MRPLFVLQFRHIFSVNFYPKSNIKNMSSEVDESKKTI